MSFFRLQIRLLTYLLISNVTGPSVYCSYLNDILSRNSDPHLTI